MSNSRFTGIPKDRRGDAGERLAEPRFVPTKDAPSSPSSGPSTRRSWCRPRPMTKPMTGPMTPSRRRRNAACRDGFATARSRCRNARVRDALRRPEEGAGPPARTRLGRTDDSGQAARQAAEEATHAGESDAAGPERDGDQPTDTGLRLEPRRPEPAGAPHGPSRRLFVRGSGRATRRPHGRTVGRLASLLAGRPDGSTAGQLAGWLAGRAAGRPARWAVRQPTFTVKVGPVRAEGETSDAKNGSGDAAEFARGG